MTMPHLPTIRRAGTLLAACAALLLHTACGHAAEAAERPFNPPVGSRWIVETATNSDDVRPEGKRTALIKSRAELTVDGRTGDGFRITYVRRGTTTEGNDPSLPLLRAGMQAVNDIPIRATTDRNGKPVRVDNLDEAKAAMKGVVDKVTAPFQDKPQVLALLHQMMARLIEVDAVTAATDYLDELPELARAQGTGMKAGDIKRSSAETENPLGGGPIKSNSSFELKEADAASGRRVYVNTTAYDPAAMKEFTQSLGKKLLAGGGGVTPAQVDDLMKQMQLSLDERTTFEVEDGMTRKMTQTSVMTARALGHHLQKTESKTVTMTPAP